MKHLDLFNHFLKDTVNLNDTRVKDLETSIEAIKDAVRASDWEPHLNGWMAHGSWAHKTIIKPVDSREFDADLIVFVEHVDGWTAATYIDELYKAFRANSTYRDMVNRSSHCVTIGYANDKTIDVAPCLTNRTNALEVCNRMTNEFEQTEPKQYTEWLVKKNGYSGNNSFRKVTRLVKYLRDIKERFTCSSVLLTTILGFMIFEADQGSADFADVPTALKTVFSRMDDELQKHATKPIVANPFLQSEDFAAAWTDDQYTNFCDKIHTYREWIDELTTNRTEARVLRSGGACSATSSLKVSPLKKANQSVRQLSLVFERPWPKLHSSRATWWMPSSGSVRGYFRRASTRSHTWKLRSGNRRGRI
jgi:Second Messenger Oligonucleotide or Dinucleotide Synthetase domain